MRFDELNEDNYMIFAIKNYDNPQAVTQDDFYEDMKRFKYVKKILKQYKNTGDLKAHLLINHFIILYNIFGEAATPLLFFKIEKEYWSQMKSVMMFLGRFPEYPRTSLHEILEDDKCLNILQNL